MLVQSSRFGQIEATQDEIVILPQGLIGFESARQWLIIPDPENEDVAWLQSVTESRVALPIVSPRKFAPDFKLHIADRQLAPLSIRKTDRIYILSVISKSGKTLTMNLRSPIVLNLTKRLACQVIADEALPLAQPIQLDIAAGDRMAA